VRIGFDAKRVFHNFRGLGNYSRNLIEGLIKFYPENEYFLFTPTITDPRALEWQKRFDNLEIVTPEGFLGKNFGSAWRSLFLSDVLKSYNLDIYHGLSHELPPGIEKLGIKSVVTIHDLIFMRYPEYFPWVDRQVYLRKFKNAVTAADSVLSICNQTKLDLINYLNVPEDKIGIVYQSCDQSFYAPLALNKKEEVIKRMDITAPYILYVGALEPRKNALLLVKAFARLTNQLPHNLVLIGDGKEYKKEIEKCITENGLRERVTFLSYVSSQDLPAIYQAADLFVYPSHFEGWGIPNVESLFSETPVITGQGSCFPESGGPNSLYCDQNSTSDLTEKIEQVLFDEHLKDTMVRSGRVYAEKFHWKQTSENLMNFYSSVLSDSN
jgi:glycosyltransferase involved in cell wall biosynthesis